MKDIQAMGEVARQMDGALELCNITQSTDSFFDNIKHREFASA